MLKRLLMLVTLWLPALTLHAETLTVMTSYPQPVVATFQAAFEDTHPDIQLNILWRRPDDALKTLLTSNAKGVDVVWMPSIITFSQLAKHHLLTPVDIDLTGLPQAIGNIPISDKKQRYLAFEIAGYGLFVDKKAISQVGLSIPHDWQALTHPDWQGKVALPIPSQLGFAPMMIDQLLQAQGWQQGWTTWQMIAANSQLVGNHSPFITDSVRSGKAMVGLMLDFFAFTTIQNPDRYQFTYPEHTAFSPAHIGITSSTTQPELANTFVSYLLSEQGQTLLLHPDVRRLPVRSALYDTHHLTANPFTLSTTQAYNYEQGRLRRGYVNMVFDAAITDSHDLLVHAWSLLHQLESNPAFRHQAKKLALSRHYLQSWPVPAPVDGSPILQMCAENQGKNAQCQQEHQRLSLLFAQHYQHVISQLEQLRVSQ